MQKNSEEYITFIDYPIGSSDTLKTFVLNVRYPIVNKTVDSYIFKRNEKDDNNKVTEILCLINKSFEYEYFTIGEIQTHNACRQ
jgi:hypothetical protein